MGLKLQEEITESLKKLPDEERKELLDEGIDLLTIPWVTKDN